ncbi:hypothetical protein F442_14612 [Phytophthora nicotianae P10297]|uniref:DDE Tnp4 domain-containing protein n=1 Tax=Phytophthora nicotianae P10297 TaxID=1317064 RepID=W2YRC4_PHYNI|nr:hypothetical protein F442_14612 [Phytophthora nicotianae P10297]
MAPSQRSTRRSSARAANRSLSPQDIAHGVSVLTQLDTHRQAAGASAASLCLVEPEDKVDSPCPIYHSFRTSDPENPNRLINFSHHEFERLWSQVRMHISENWNVGRGRKCEQTPKNVFFMVLTVLKHCGKWDVVASIFRFKTGAFQKMILSFAGVIAPFLYDRFVASVANKFTMEQLVLGGNTFDHHPYPRYATDVTFQQSNMPSGKMKERASYYSAKHHLHGHKVEVSVLPNGLALNCTKHYLGIKADIEIFRHNHAFHLQHLLKSSSERNMTDEGPMKDKYPDSWCVLADKGYQGLADDFRVITPIKKRPLQQLTLDEGRTNDRIAHDRVIVENYFGRLTTLWAMCSDKYRWDKNNYDMLFRSCVALTNFHVRILPLRDEDGENYSNYLKRLQLLGNGMRPKRLEVQRHHREKRRMRLRGMLTDHIERPLSGSHRIRAMAKSDSESEDLLNHESYVFS